MNADNEAAREGIAVGIIGMGDMGKMYARRIAAAGWRYVLKFP
jgi:3-hydroxyisobutyrate dehydrogenase-like beta-hydroxyacid dehydrogenase